MAPRTRKADDKRTLVAVRGEVAEIDPLDMTFAELDEVRRLLALVPNVDGLPHVIAAAHAFVVLKRQPTFAAWLDDTFLGLKPSDVDLDPKGTPPGEA